MVTWFDFSHHFDKTMPVPDWPDVERQEFTLKTFFLELNGGTQNYLSMNLHSGTHLDAPSHFVQGGKSIDEIDFTDLMGECSVIDLNKGSLEPVTVSDLRSHEERTRGKKIIFLRTGWEDKWGTKAYESEYPFLANETAPYLIGLGIKIIGLDTPGPDAPLRSPFRKGSPLHRELLSNEVLIIENLTNLSAAVSYDLFVHAYPISIKGATGSPARVIARVI